MGMRSMGGVEAGVVEGVTPQRTAFQVNRLQPDSDKPLHGQA